MFQPGFAPTTASTTTLLAVLLSGSAWAATSEPTHEAIVGKYHYDPAAHEAKPPETAKPEEPAADSAPAGRPRPRVADPAEHIPAEIPALTPASAATVDVHGTLVLPKMSIPGVKAKLPPRLPQLYVAPPVRNLPAEPFETPAARDARLIKKYFTPLEQKLGGPGLAAKARQQEAIASSSAQLNDIADLLELSFAVGTETAEEQKKLRAEYFRALAEKPR